MRNVVKALNELTEEPFASIVCYPKVRENQLRKRLRELCELGITALEFSGQKQLFNTNVLGKGCVGIVVLALRTGRRVALKIRRVDADRKTMTREAELLRKANLVMVGPRLLEASKDFLVMQFIKGDLLPRWVEDGASIARTKKVVRDILEQCWRLDVAGLDHGELSHAPKHIIVTAKLKPVIVDFETASEDRRPSNVTSACQFLLMSKTIPTIARQLRVTDREVVIRALQDYKREPNRKNFDQVLESCGL